MTTSAPTTFSARWPSVMEAPRLTSLAVTADFSQVGAGDLVSQVEQHLGDTAHADAANADEMDALNLCKHGEM